MGFQLRQSASSDDIDINIPVMLGNPPQKDSWVFLVHESTVG